LAPMPNPRNHMGGAALNGKIYAIGGQHKGQQSTAPQDEVDVYDPATNTWTQAAPMPRPIGHVTANVFVRNGHVVVVSGLTTNSTLPNTLAYDLSTGLWRSDLASRPYLGDHHAAEVINGKLYLFGGLNVFGPKVAAGKVQIYDPVTNSWSLGAPMPWAVGSVS